MFFDKPSCFGLFLRVRQALQDVITFIAQKLGMLLQNPPRIRPSLSRQEFLNGRDYGAFGRTTYFGASARRLARNSCYLALLTARSERQRPGVALAAGSHTTRILFGC